MKGVVLAMMLVATSAYAEAVSDLLMQPGLLADIPDQELPHYKHDRKLDSTATVNDSSGAAPKEITNGGVMLSRVTDEAGDKLRLSLSEADQSHVVAELPVQTSNPILLFFLENIVRTVSAQTGGSPYYIRNRIREELVAAQVGDEQPAFTEVILHPFAKDPNAARLGEFANLTITLRYDPAQPFRLLELLANTGSDGSGYNETMTLVGEK